MGDSVGHGHPHLGVDVQPFDARLGDDTFWTVVIRVESHLIVEQHDEFVP